MTMDYIRKSRGLPFLKRGMRVQFLHNGRFGKITGANIGGNINIRFDGDTFSQNCHPRWRMRYFDKEGNVIREFTD